MQLKINSHRDTISEWIPYSQFDDIREIKNGLHSATWNNGPLNYNISEGKYKRNESEKVALKYFYDLQNIATEVCNFVNLLIITFFL
jgi:hypothetical protein